MLIFRGCRSAISVPYKQSLASYLLKFLIKIVNSLFATHVNAFKNMGITVKTSNGNHCFRKLDHEEFCQEMPSSSLKIVLSFRQRVSIFPLISLNGGDLHLTEIMKLTTAIISAWNQGSVSPAIVNNRDLGTETKCASCVGYILGCLLMLLLLLLRQTVLLSRRIAGINCHSADFSLIAKCRNSAARCETPDEFLSNARRLQTASEELEKVSHDEF